MLLGTLRQAVRVDVCPLPPDQHDAAIALWHDAGLTRPWNDPRADLERAVAGPASTVLAVLDGEQLLGTVMLGHDGHRGWVYYLAVTPDARGRGHGRAMMAAAEAWLRARGCPALRLMVRLDLQLRSGGGVPAAALLERALMRLAAPRDRPGGE